MVRIYKSNEVDDQRFYKIPKSLFGNDLYKGLSIESKVVYSFLRDRMELSKVNGWINEQGEVYLIFVRENIAKLLETSLPTITKAFKQLISHELIFEKRQGQGKPNLIFVCHIELTPIITEKQNILVSGYKEKLHQDTKKVCTNDTDRINTNNIKTDKKNKASLPANDGCGYVDKLSEEGLIVFRYFIKSYMKNIGEVHPTINKSVVDKLNSIMSNGYIYDPDTDKELYIEVEEMETIIDKYFETDYPLREGGQADHRIYHFLSDMVMKNLYYKELY